MRYEEIEHTADVGIRAYGKGLPEIFANAAEGMFNLIVDLEGVKPVGEVQIRLRAADPTALLVAWLRELLFVHETQGLLFRSFDVAVEGLSLEATARGEAIDKARHELRLAIKAVTYHGLALDAERGFAQIIFDI